MLQTFGSHPQSKLQAQKGVSRVGLEAQPLHLEHLLIKKVLLGIVKGDTFMF